MHRLLRWMIPLAVLIAGLGVWQPVTAQTTSASGLIAFLGVTPDDQADIYLLDLASGQVGRLNAPVSEAASLAWNPASGRLAFTTAEGGYGILNNLNGCLSGSFVCQNISYYQAVEPVTALDWTPDGAWLVLQGETDLWMITPLARDPEAALAANVTCPAGMDVAQDAFNLVCAAPQGENVAVSLHTLDAITSDAVELAPLVEIGVYSGVTVLAAGPDQQAAVGTLEGPVDSGHVAHPDGAVSRLTDERQIHPYALSFAPHGAQLAVVGAIADSTGNGSLRDGDAAELFLYDTAAQALNQVPGFTGATGATWSPDGSQLLVADRNGRFLLYTPETQERRVLPAELPQPDLAILALAWDPVSLLLPPIPAATAAPTQPPALPIASATPVPSPTPPPVTPTSLATYTPFPTLTPYPTFTPFPSATPGSPIGSGCQYAYPTAPVAVGDVAMVTRFGAGLRLRGSAALTGIQIRELPAGVRMRVLDGPLCSQGYRWWRVQIESDGQLGWVADSEPEGYWIERAPAPTATPTNEPFSVTFTANPAVLTNAGECTTVAWAVSGIKEVYYMGREGLDNEPVIGTGSRVECVNQSTFFRLKVIKTDDTVTYWDASVTVLNPAP